MPQVLALATELLFERLDTMSKTATDRFINWFGHHLSNFQFRWSWDEWADCLSQGTFDKKYFFVANIKIKIWMLQNRILSVKFWRNVGDSVIIKELLKRFHKISNIYFRMNQILGKISDTVEFFSTIFF